MESYKAKKGISSAFPNDEQSNWYQRIFFSWVKPLLSYGALHNVSEENFFELNRSDDPSECAQQLATSIGKHYNKKSPLVYSLFHANRNIFLISLMLGGVHAICNIGLIRLLKSFLYFLESTTSILSEGVGFAFCLCLLGVITWTSIHHCFLYSARLAIRVKGSLTYYLYERYLQLLPQTRSQITSGEINNLLMQDTLRISVAAEALTMTMVSIFVIVAATILLYLQIGLSGLVGVIAAFVFIPISNAINNKISQDSKSLQEISDSRISVMKELLEHAKKIKVMSWSIFFHKLIAEVRQTELGALKNLIWNTALLNLVIQVSPLFVACVTFGVYTLLGKSLDLPTVLSVIAIFGVLKTPVMHLPRLIIEITDAQVSLERVSDFLKLQTVSSEIMENDSNNLGAINFKSAHIGWNENVPILNDITLKIQPGQLLGLAGMSGTGKTSFLNAILNESLVLDGKHQVHGKISYAPQHAFIISGTIRDNILFGSEFTAEKYWNVIHACSLLPDLEIFPGSDLSIIIENGANLSGGQKQRIALARALYREADIYLFDDSFSALDEKVGNEIFQQAILIFLKDKTRIVATHKLEFIKYCDQKFMLQDSKLLNIDERVGSVNLKQLDTPSLFHSMPSVSEAALNRLNVTEEVINSAKINNKLYLLYYAKAGGLFILGTILLMFGIRELLMVGSDYWLSYWTANSVLSNSQIFTGFVLIGSMASAATFYRGLLLLNASNRVAQKMHDEMLSSILNAPIKFFESNPIGKILNRFSRDVRVIDREIGPRFLDGISVFFVLTSAFVIIEMTNIYMIFIMAAIGVFYYWIQAFYRSTAPAINRLEAEAQSPLVSHFNETMDGVVSIKVFERQRSYILQNYTKLVSSLRATYTQYVIGRWLSVNLDLLGVIMLGVVALVAVFTRTYVSWSLAGLSVTYVLMITVNFQRSVHNLTDLEISMTSLERINAYSNIPSEIQIDTHRVGDQWPSLGSIKFDNVSLRYDEDSESILKHVSFDIKPSQKIGVIGRTGSGKSSLINAIFKLHPLQDGAIYIDDVNIANLSPEILRKRIHLLPQDPLFIAGTLRMNLDPYQMFTDTELIAAIKAMGCFSFFENLDNGFDFKLKAGGSNVSLGHRQLLSLARVFLANPKILLLDEATANVDVQTDRYIHELIQEYFHHVTVVTIAHRLETVINSDLILCMERGEIVDFASPAELCKKESSRLYHYENNQADNHA